MEETTKKETGINYEELYRFMREKRDESEEEVAKLKQEIELFYKIVGRLVNNK